MTITTTHQDGRTVVTVTGENERVIVAYAPGDEREVMESLIQQTYEGRMEFEEAIAAYDKIKESLT